jgi:hypothetical protein
MLRLYIVFWYQCCRMISKQPDRHIRLYMLFVMLRLLLQYNYQLLFEIDIDFVQNVQFHQMYNLLGMLLNLAQMHFDKMFHRRSNYQPYKLNNWSH